jgi:hypothetical protein
MINLVFIMITNHRKILGELLAMGSMILWQLRPICDKIYGLNLHPFLEQP